MKTPPASYRLQVETVKMFTHGDDRLEPCIFLNDISPQSADRDLFSLWSWLSREADGAAPSCMRDPGPRTLAGLADDLVSFINANDREIVESAIEAIKGFDFHPDGHGKRTEMVRRDEL